MINYKLSIQGNFLCSDKSRAITEKPLALGVDKFSFTGSQVQAQTWEMFNEKIFTDNYV